MIVSHFAKVKSRTILGELLLILHGSLRNHRLWITADVSCCLTCQELAIKAEKAA